MHAPPISLGSKQRTCHYVHAATLFSRSICQILRCGCLELLQAATGTCHEASQDDTLAASALLLAASDGMNPTTGSADLAVTSARNR